MQSLSEFMKRCDIEKILMYLSSGNSALEKERLIKRYYALYCRLMESWYSGYTEKIVLTDYCRPSFYSEDGTCCFYGITDLDKPDLSEAQRIDWEDIYEEQKILLVPDCLWESVGKEVLAAEILYKMGNYCDFTLQAKTNIRLLAHIAGQDVGETELMTMYRPILEDKIHYLLDKHFLLSEITDYRESLCLKLRWGELLRWNGDFKTEFAVLDPQNPPNYARALKQRESLRRAYENVTQADYEEVRGFGGVLIVEKNRSCEKLPLIYIRNRWGEKFPLNNHRSSTLLSLEIRILDDDMPDFARLLAAILFYLEYPIRAERILKEKMTERLTGLLSAGAQKTAPSVRNIGILQARRGLYEEWKKMCRGDISWPVV